MKINKKKAHEQTPEKIKLKDNFSENFQSK